MWNVFKKTAIQYNYTKPAVLINNDMTNDYNCDGYKPLLVSTMSSVMSSEIVLIESHCACVYRILKDGSV